MICQVVDCNRKEFTEPHDEPLLATYEDKEWGFAIELHVCKFHFGGIVVHADNLSDD